ncbi:acid protease [Suillus decipiens]|nr:acid protease [Suillus decipiens]
MFPAVLLTLLLVFSTTGSPVKANNSSISVPLTSRLYFSNGTNDLLEHDRAHVKALGDPSMRSQSSVNVPLTNDYRNYGHSLAVGIGNPPTTYNGSANIWVSGSKYVETGVSFCTGQPVAFIYASGFFSRTEWLDYVTVGPGLTVIKQSISVADDETADLENYDGIIGIGPVALTVGTLQDLPKEPIPTVTDSLVGQGTISENVLGIFFEPYTNPPPAVNTGHSQRFWGVNSRITYDNRVILGSTDGIIDCGTTLIVLASDAYQEYRLATGAKYDSATNLLTMPEDKYGTLHNLDFHIGESPNAQIWPRSLNTNIRGKEGSIYLIFRDRGRPSGQDGISDFTLGYVFMQRFYVAYDFTTSRAGFATTAFTDATTN